VNDSAFAMTVASLSNDEVRDALRNTAARAHQFVAAGQALRAAYSPTDGPALMRTIHDVEARALAEREHRNRLQSELRRRGVLP
jgi:hypothetical protein